MQKRRHGGILKRDIYPLDRMGRVLDEPVIGFDHPAFPFQIFIVDVEIRPLRRGKEQRRDEIVLTRGHQPALALELHGDIFAAAAFTPKLGPNIVKLFHSRAGPAERCQPLSAAPAPLAQ